MSKREPMIVAIQGHSMGGSLRDIHIRVTYDSHHHLLGKEVWIPYGSWLTAGHMEDNPDDVYTVLLPKRTYNSLVRKYASS